VRVTIAVAQMTSRDDVPANVATATTLVREAKARGARIVGLPENFAFLGEHERDKLEAQESLDGPTISHFRALARELEISLVLGGFQERSDDPERPFNTSVAIDARGEMVARYRKIHMFDVDVGATARLTESKHTRAGDKLVVTELAGVPVGLSICYDLRFGALYEALADAGAKLLTVPAAFTLLTGKDHWEVLLRARAIEFQAFVMAPAQLGYHNPKRHSFGAAMIIDPWGTVLARCPETEGICLAEIDLAYLDEVRRRLPSLDHRRPALYRRGGDLA